MSVASGLKLYRIPIKPVNQTTGQGNFNNVVQTYLDKGTYVFFYNVAWQCPQGTMTVCQSIITRDLPFNSGGSEICGIKQNAMGSVGGSTPNGFSMQNTIFISNDHTPIFVGAFNTIGVGAVWGVPANTQYDKWMNYLTIIKVQ